MNENNIVSIDAVIDRIKICGYIDCNEDGYYDEYEYDNILYYLEKYKNLQFKIDKAIEYINKLKNFKIKYVMLEEKELYASEKDFVKDLLDILKEDK